MNAGQSNRPAGQSSLSWVSFVNESGADIPPFAVLRIQGVDATRENALKAYQPNGSMTCDFAISAGRTVPVGSGGVCTTGLGAWALYDDDGGADVPSPGDTWGPGNGDWLLHKGGEGFTIIGDGEQLSVDAATYHRVRVSRAAGAAVDDIIIGSAVGAVLATDATFTIDDITVESGTDPRPEPVSSAQTVTVNNTYAEAYANNARIRAKRNKATNEWNVLKEAAGGNVLVGRLATDLTETMDEVTVTIDFASNSETGDVTCVNPVNKLRYDYDSGDNSTWRYLFVGNEDGWCAAMKAGDDWHLVAVQNPHTRPVAPP